MSKTEWKKVRLGEVCNMYQPRTISQEEMIDDGKYPVFGANGIIGRYDKYNHELPQLLITCRGATCGTINTSEPYSWITGNSMVVRSKDENLLSFEYLSYYLGQKHLISHVITGAAQPQITRSNLQELNILFPTNIETQRRIAATLDKTNELIALRKKQLKELDVLAEAVFFDMFGDPVKNKKGWETIDLKKATNKIGSGATPRGGNENYKSEGINFIRSLNVYNGKFQYRDLAHIDEEQARLLDNVTVHKNDVLLNITGASVARCCIVPEGLLPARVNQHVAIIRTKKDLNHIYLTSVFTSQSYQQKLLRLSKSNGATREALTKADIENLQILLPPLPLQTRFATIIEKIEEQKAQVRKALQESEDLFQRLMQDLFKPD